MFSVHRVILLGLLVAVMAMAAPTEKLSNSELMAKGLPLNPPKRLYDPSRTRLHARQDPSASSTDPINAFIRVDPVGAIPRRHFDERGMSWNYLWNHDGYYQMTTETPDTYTFYPSDASKVDAGVYSTRWIELGRKAKRYLDKGWFGFYQVDASKDVNSVEQGYLSTGLFYTPSTAAGYDNIDYIQTRIFNKPVIGDQVSITWYNAANQAVVPKFYYIALGQAKPRIYAALDPKDIGPGIGAEDEVTLTWVLPENLNMSP